MTLPLYTPDKAAEATFDNCVYAEKLNVFESDLQQYLSVFVQGYKRN